MNTALKGFLLSLTTLLWLASGMKVAQAAEEEWVYQVVSGDNLWNLTERYLLDMSYVQRVRLLNRIADPYHVPPGTYLRIPVEWLAASAAVAKVETLQGRAEAIEEATGNVTELHKDAVVMAGHAVRTGDASTVVLKFVDGSSVTLMANSHLSLHSLKIYNSTGLTDTRLNLEKGRVETRVIPKSRSGNRFQIATPTAVTSVRGTNYRVSAEPEEVVARAEVLTGQVAVANQNQSRNVPEGFGTVAEYHKPPTAPIKLLEPPDLSGLPKPFTRIPLQWTMPSLPAAEAYRVQIASDSSYNTLVFDQKFYTNQMSVRDLPDGNYYFRVRAIDRNGLEGKNADAVITLHARPQPPLLLKPKANADIAEDTPEFLWAKPEGITQYRLQIAGDKAFSRLIADMQVDQLPVAAPLALALGDYFWRVAAIDAKNNEGPFSDPQNFKRVPAPPVLADPEIGDDAITITASVNGFSSAQYQFQVARDENFQQLILDRHIPQTSLTLEPQPPGTYYVRVRGIDQNGNAGPFGATQMLEITEEDWYYWLLLLPLLGLIAI